MVATMLFMIAAIFIPFFSTGLEMFLAGGMIQGLPWGIFQTLSISYAAYDVPFDSTIVLPS